MKKPSVRELTLTAAFAALMTVCSWISVPVLAVPFTLQTFAVEMTLYCLGGRTGFLAIAVYLLMGLAGVPVFSGFNGGAGYLLGPTGGYLLGFLATALVWTVIEKRCTANRWLRLGGMAAAVAACYAVGTVWFHLVYGKAKGMSIGGVLSVCVVPFLIPDALKLMLAEEIGWRVRRAVHLSVEGGTRDA